MLVMSIYSGGVWVRAGTASRHIGGCICSAHLAAKHSPLLWQRLVAWLRAILALSPLQQQQLGRLPGPGTAFAADIHDLL